jgi:hypothetical protein
LEPYLEVHLDPVEGRGAGAGYGPGDATGEEVTPPHPRDHFAVCEVIRYADVLTNVHILLAQEAQDFYQICARAVRAASFSFLDGNRFNGA